jgi:hypothetical protein
MRCSGRPVSIISSYFAVYNEHFVSEVWLPSTVLGHQHRLPRSVQSASCHRHTILIVITFLERLLRLNRGLQHVVSEVSAAITALHSANRHATALPAAADPGTATTHSKA